MPSFDHITTSGSKFVVIFEFSVPVFPIKTRSFRARDTIIADFCDDNVCACAVSTFILLTVVNISSKMDSAISISCVTETVAVRRCFSPNYRDVSLRMRSFDHITTSGLKSAVIFEFSEPVFP